MVSLKLDWIYSFLVYVFRVDIPKLESTCRDSDVAEDRGVESALWCVVVEEIDSDRPTVNSSSPGKNVGNVPRLVNLSVSQSVSLINKWIDDCQLCCWTGIYERDCDELCRGFVTNGACDSHYVFSWRKTHHVRCEKRVVASFWIKKTLRSNL